MTLTDERLHLAHVPVRICTLTQAGPRPAVLVYHGLGVDIGIQTPELHSLAQAGFCAVGIDAVGHGQRRWPDFDARFAPQRWSQSFAQVLEQSLAELPGLVDGLVQTDLVHPERLGIAGISMGGFITYGAALVEPRLRALCPILASPRYPAEARHQPEQQPQAFFPRALLSHSAGLDELVPPEQARHFHHRLKPLYASAPERLEHVEVPGCGHFMPQDAWEKLWQRVLAWFCSFL